MMDENLNHQKSSISAPPEPEVTIRTLDSDVKAVEQGGGEMIVPKAVNLEESRTEARLNIPGYTGPEKAIFASTATIAEEGLSDEKSGKWKIIGLIIGILAIISFFGFLGYYIIFPWFFSEEMPAVQYGY